MTNNQQESNIDLFQVLKRILRFRYRIILLTLILSGLSIYFILKLPKMYASTSVIVQTSSGTSAGGGLGALSALTGISLGGDNSGDVSAYLSEIVTTRPVLEQIAQKKWRASVLSKDTTQEKTLAEWWQMIPDTTQPDWERRFQEDVISTLGREKRPYITYEVDPKTRLVSLKTEFEDPKIAYDINLFLSDILNIYVNDKRHYKAGQTSEFILQRVQESKADLLSAEQKLLHFRKMNMVRVSPEMMLEESRLQRDLVIQQELYLQFQKQYELARIDDLREKTVLDVIEPPRMARKPTSPKIPLLISLGFAASLVVSIFLFLLYGYWKDNRKELKELLEP